MGVSGGEVVGGGEDARVEPEGFEDAVDFRVLDVVSFCFFGSSWECDCEIWSVPCRIPWPLSRGHRGRLARRWPFRSSYFDLKKATWRGPVEKALPRSIEALALQTWH